MTPEPSIPAIPWYDNVVSWFAMAWWRHRATILFALGTLLAIVPLLPWDLVGTIYFLAVAGFGLICVREVLRLIRLRASK